jgi:hypothetical protein
MYAVSPIEVYIENRSALPSTSNIKFPNINLIAVS